MRAANFAPVYCALYPQLAEIAREHGYALSVHGTLGRDMDLVCIPWADFVSDPRVVIDAITSKFSIELVSGPAQKNHGRLAWTITLGFGECFIDMSFMPKAPA